MIYFFFFNDTATTEIYTLSLHDALPIFLDRWRPRHAERAARGLWRRAGGRERHRHRDRPGGSAQAVSGVRAARREREPPLRRDGPRPRALETPGRAARRHHWRGVGARQG